jgi:hypothetical protein
VPTVTLSAPIAALPSSRKLSICYQPVQLPFRRSATWP